MALTTFDRELYEQGLREEGEKIGETRGEARGEVRGKELGEGKSLLESVNNLQKNLNLSLEDALNALGKTMKDYEKAKELLK